jgi:hypothetical protein
MARATGDADSFGSASARPIASLAVETADTPAE